MAGRKIISAGIKKTKYQSDWTVDAIFKYVESTGISSGVRCTSIALVLPAFIDCSPLL
jgi:hypothetical protein